MNGHEIGFFQNLFNALSEFCPDFLFNIFVSLYIIIDDAHVKAMFAVVRHTRTDSAGAKNA